MTLPVAEAAQPASDQRWDPWLAGAVALGVAIRLYHVAAADFPLNDGGLFLMMIEAIRAGHYALPHSIPWAQFDLPFAYPPLAFYAAAAIRDLTGTSTVELVRVLPLVGSALTMLTFAGLARALLVGRLATFIAVTAFALMPQAYNWMVAGGGLTRAFGQAFALFALHQLLLQFRRPSRRHLAGACVGAALTALTHPESALFLAVSAVLLSVSFGRSTRGLQSAFSVGASTLLVTSPWWLLILQRHGVGPLVAGGGNSGNVAVISALLTGAGLDAFAMVRLVAVAAAGVTMIALARRGWFPAACVLAALVFSRNTTLLSAPPFALLLAAVAVAVLPSAPDRGTTRALLRDWLPDAKSRTVALTLVSLAILMAVVTLRPPMPVLPRAERDAMAWIAAETPGSARFLVLSTRGERSTIDPTGDWFSALSGRIGLSPPQGTEWIGRYPETELAYARLQQCRSQDTTCLERWAVDEGLDFGYVYVPAVARGDASKEGSCCGEIALSLLADPNYRLAYDGDGASVFERVGHSGR